MYNMRWSADIPGCLVFLIDQSPATGAVIGAGLIGAQTRRADAIAMVVNNIVHELVQRCRVGTVVRPRIDIAILGYGVEGRVQSAFAGTIAGKELLSITDLANNPLKVNETVATEFEPETGGLIQIPTKVWIWLEPAVGTDCPMCAALDAATRIVGEWVNSHATSAPPVVINVCCGTSTDGDPWLHALELTKLATNDGHVLLFNCHVTGSGGYPIWFPTSYRQIPSDPWAIKLFTMSSNLPDDMVAMGNILFHMGLQPEARGFISGGGLESFTQLFTIGSLPKMELGDTLHV
jgi:hypothetical protein